MKHDKGKTDNNALRRGMEDEGPDAEGCARRSTLAQRLLEECEGGLSRKLQERTGWEAVRCNRSPKRSVTFLDTGGNGKGRFQDKTRSKCNTTTHCVTWA